MGHSLESNGILLLVWQETSRHIEIEAAMAAIAPTLSARIPMETAVISELDVGGSRLETVAAVGTAGVAPVRAPIIELSRSEVPRLLAWCRRPGALAHRGGGDPLPPGLGRCVPSDAGDALVGSLTRPTGRPGVLIVLARGGHVFEPRHAAVVQALLEPLSVALDNHQRLRELTALREAAEAEKQSLLTRLGRTEAVEVIVGAGAGLRPVMERVGLVARSDVPVLILGETGAGKEVIARAIHTRSPRAAGPFIRVNCGAIPPELIDSQLFGHERGSFTGAVEMRKGWFERADGGTLFLDEIGDLPPAAQVRLLRVLQDGLLERIGGQEPIRVDTRIVTATHRDLTRMVREGRFREDLWYRVAVFPVLLPPLRERRDDIPELARHFAQRSATRFGLPLRMPSSDDLAALMAYPWPGNVRELAAVIDRAVILGNGERLEIVPALGIGGVQAGPSAPPVAPEPGTVAGRDRMATLDTAVRRHIESALVATRGRSEGPHGAARLLGVNPHTLRARMRRLGIAWGRFRDGGG